MNGSLRRGIGGQSGSMSFGKSFANIECVDVFRQPGISQRVDCFKERTATLQRFKVFGVIERRGRVFDVFDRQTRGFLGRTMSFGRVLQGRRTLGNLLNPPQIQSPAASESRLARGSS